MTPLAWFFVGVLLPLPVAFLTETILQICRPRGHQPKPSATPESVPAPVLRKSAGHPYREARETTPRDMGAALDRINEQLLDLRRDLMRVERRIQRMEEKG